MKKTEDEELNVKIVSPEEAFWINKRDLSERMIKQLEEDLIEIPRLIDFHKKVVDMCEEELDPFTRF